MRTPDIRSPRHRRLHPQVRDDHRYHRLPDDRGTGASQAQTHIGTVCCVRACMQDGGDGLQPAFTADGCGQHGPFAKDADISRRSTRRSLRRTAIGRGLELTVPASTANWQSRPFADGRDGQLASISTCRPRKLAAKRWTHTCRRQSESCPSCDGELTIIAGILNQPAIEKILKHLGLHDRAPPHVHVSSWQLKVA